RSGVVFRGRAAAGEVRHVDHHRVRAPDQRRAQPPSRLVVERPLPPVAGHELGQDHEGDRSLLVGDGPVQRVEVSDHQLRQRQPARRSPSQWRTMPDWLIVNEMKTPTEYSGISAVVLPPNRASSAIATTLRITMPEVNASRSPRNANVRGM